MGVFKSKRNILVLVMFVASILYILYLLIFVDGNSGKLTKMKKYNEEEVAVYTVKENIVKDYNKFYTLEDISSQIITALKEENYSGLYTIISSEFAGDISKEQWKEVLKNFYLDNFSDITNEFGEKITYSINMNLVTAYHVEPDIYFLEVKNNHNTTSKIGIQILNYNKFKIVYLEF